jgi:hypothetical protein
VLYFGPIECRLCGKSVDLKTGFHTPVFVWNQADPFFALNDTLVHPHCLKADARLLKRMERYDVAVDPAQRRCVVCRELIVDRYKDHLMLPYFTSDENDPLFQFNYAHFHRSHVREWRDLTHLYVEIRRLSRSLGWEGDSLRNLMEMLRGIDSALGLL